MYEAAEYPATGGTSVVLWPLVMLVILIVITAFILAIIALVRTAGLNRRVSNLEQQLFAAKQQQNPYYSNNVNPNIQNGNQNNINNGFR